jgi:hypothetical protein
MSPIATEDFWEDLLYFIEQGKVVPVTGEHALAFGESNEPLYPWLAKELADRLNVTSARLAAAPTLNHVAREHLLAGGERNAIYTRLSRILREPCPQLGRTLREFARWSIPLPRLRDSRSSTFTLTRCGIPAGMILANRGVVRAASKGISGTGTFMTRSDTRSFRQPGLQICTEALEFMSGRTSGKDKRQSPQRCPK